MPIRAVVFDLFDTLVDLRMEDLPRLEFEGRRISGTARDLHRAAQARTGIAYEPFVRALVEVDRAFLSSHYAKHVELPTETRFAALVERLALDAPELAGVLTDVHMDRLRACVDVPEHHRDVLASLRGTVQTAICSNFSHSATALRILDEAGLGDAFDAVVISEDVGVRKPRREIFEAVLTRLGCDPSEVLHVGDNLEADVGGASALGIRSVWLTRRVRDPEHSRGRYTGPEPYAAVADLAQVAQLVGEGADLPR